jgi:uncharacterized protein
MPDSTTAKSGPPAFTCIATFGSRWFDLAAPAADDITLCTVAHSLAKLCRFTGHLTAPYSVAQHSVAVSRLLKDEGHGPRVQLLGLLHDAGEAYTGDISRPMKLACPAVAQLCDRVQAVAFAALFDQPTPAEKELIATADDRLLVAEAERWLPGGARMIGYPENTKAERYAAGRWVKDYWPPNTASDRYVATYYDLIGPADESAAKPQAAAKPQRIKPR